MDRKKTIVAAVVINAGLLALLFIAAMTMREDREEKGEQVVRAPKEERPLFNEIVEVQAPLPAVPDSPPVAFALPSPETPAALPAEPSPSASLAATQPTALEIEVQKGDSLEKLAKLHKTSVDEIIKLNQLPSSFLRVGQRLKIPAEKTIDAPKSKSPVFLTEGQAEYYTMKVGDNPWSIAMKHHMKVDELLKLNGLNEKSARKLKPGDRLRIK